MKNKIHSILERATTEVFQVTANNLETAKFNLIVDLGLSRIKYEDRYRMQQTIASITTPGHLQKYICNALLKYEGMGTVTVKK